VARRRAGTPVFVIARTIRSPADQTRVSGEPMSLSMLSVVGVAALSGGVAAGLSALVVVAAAWLLGLAVMNAIRLLGELLEAVEDGGPYADDARHL
jgi:hypothetical protein